MAGITGQGTSYGLPNFVGELFAVTPSDTPFLSAIGGLTGGVPTKSKQFQWQGYDLRSATPNNAALEGANAPTAQERVRFNVSNITEVHQEAIEVSYTAQAASGQYSGLNIAGVNPVQDEFNWQIEAMLKQIARDVEQSFVNGVLHTPTDNTTVRQTNGLLNAVVTNRVDKSTVLGTGLAAAASGDTITSTAHGLSNGTVLFLENSTAAGLPNGDYFLVGAATNTFQVSLTKGGAAVDITANGTVDVSYATAAVAKADIDHLLQSVYDNGGIMEQETATLMVGSGQKINVTAAYLTAGNYREQSRTIAGVTTQTIDTDFGTLNVMLNRHMPRGQIAVVSLEECAPVLLEIPDKGFLFVEPLAKVGAANRAQIYGEIGLKYGNERKHGVLTGLSE